MPARCLYILICVALVAGPIQAAEAPKLDAAKLAEECDGLLRTVVKKPYGWAFAAAEQPDKAMPKGTVIVRLDAGLTPTAGFVLLLAGEELKKDSYKAAAKQIARGLASAQQPNGRIPSRAMFAPMATPRDERSAVADRGPTIAGLALLLSLIETKNDDEVIRRAAVRAAGWLSREQTPLGAWPVMMEEGGTSPARRLVRLDTRDFRDSTIALLMSAEVLEDKILKKSAERAVEYLLKVRLENSRTARGLWRAAYELDGQASDRLDQGLALDMLASRRAMQTLLAAQVAMGGEPGLNALKTAAATAKALRYEDKRWKRLYPLSGLELTEPVKGNAQRGGTPFSKDREFEQDVNSVGDFGITSVVSLTEKIIAGPREQYPAALGLRHSWKREFAIAMAALSDGPFLSQEGNSDDLESKDELVAHVKTIATLLRLAGE